MNKHTHLSKSTAFDWQVGEGAWGIKSERKKSEIQLLYEQYITFIYYIMEASHEAPFNQTALISL